MTQLPQTEIDTSVSDYALLTSAYKQWAAAPPLPRRVTLPATVIYSTCTHFIHKLTTEILADRDVSVLAWILIPDHAIDKQELDILKHIK